MDEPKANILLVDDSPDGLVALEATLTDLGQNLVKARSGKEVLKWLLHNECAVILLDVRMPIMDGFETAALIRKREKSRRTPIIFITGISTEETHVSQAYSLGAVDYLFKPIVPEIVRAKVEVFVDLWTIERERARELKEHQSKIESANQELRTSAVALEEKNKKLRELTDTAHRFVDNVAHEFRTPLAVIHEFAAIINDGIGGPVTDQQREYLQFITTATRDLARMVDDFLDSSKLKTGMLRVDRRRHQVSTILDSVRSIVSSRAAAKKVELVEKVEPDLPAVFADLEKVGRVIINLAVNAVKFSPEASQILLTAKRGSDGGVQIDITDQGPGLAPHEVAVICERFKQVSDPIKTSTKGFGLGLNIAKELIWLNLGQMRIESEPGKGSTFSFSLPPDDPQIVLSHYLDLIREHAPNANLAILDVSTAQGQSAETDDSDSAESDAEALRCCLASVCYPTDLMFKSADGKSVIVIGATFEPDHWAHRLHSAWAARTKNNKNARCSGLNTRLIGRWSHDEPRKAISSCVLGRVLEGCQCV